MAIRKDIDDMLNILKTGKQPEKPVKKKDAAPGTSRTRNDSRIDNMSVDDLLSTLTGIKSPAAAQKPAEKTAEQPAPAEAAPKKKKIVISGELPDYEALRAQELERDRLERERIEAERKTAEQAERERAKAEKARIEAEKQAAEEAERARLEAERQAEIERIAAERKAAEEARLEAERQAAEEARLEAERKAAEEARLEAERKAAEEARLEAERKAAEEARLEAERKAAEEARLEAERKAAEEARLEAERKAAERAERRAAEEAESARLEDEQREAIGEDLARISAENANEPTIDELMDAAIAAAKAAEAQFLAAEKAAQELSEYEPDPVESLLGNIRDEAEKVSDEIENPEPAAEESQESAEQSEASEDETASADEPTFTSIPLPDELTPEEEAPKLEKQVKKLSRLTSAMEQILDEDPDAIIERSREKTEPDEDDAPSGGKLKKGFYTVCGIIFSVLACIGLITVIAKTISFFGSYTSGDTHKEVFSEVVYPAVIMDIESFNEPSELPSDQILTAAIWSMILSQDALDDYEKTFDVVKIPAADVESYAVKLFGDDLPELTHNTIGPAEARFYYNDETKSYNVPVTPITFTYSPVIKSATKNGSEYTVAVDYIDELPQWIQETSSKSVEFTLKETNDGYVIRAMKIISTSSNSI